MRSNIQHKTNRTISAGEPPGTLKGSMQEFKRKLDNWLMENDPSYASFRKRRPLRKKGQKSGQ